MKKLSASSVYLLLLLLITAMTPLQSADVLVTFDNPEHSQLYHALLREYRCLKCQNQNLADSNASLAGDLRREIRDQILAGKAKKDIDEYLVARYGEFVLYRPRFNAKTALLWVAPFLLLGIALASLFYMVRQRNRQPDHLPIDVTGNSVETQQAQLEKARRLLEE